MMTAKRKVMRAAGAAFGASFLVSLALGAVLAQQTVPPRLPDTNQDQRLQPAQPNTAPPGEPGSGSTTAPRAGRPDANSPGVIVPPSTGDQGIITPAPPSAGTPRMPVIPPPGTPGTNPEVQPK